MFLLHAVIHPMLRRCALRLHLLAGLLRRCLEHNLSALDGELNCL